MKTKYKPFHILPPVNLHDCATCKNPGGINSVACKLCGSKPQTALVISIVFLGLCFVIAVIYNITAQSN